MKTKVLLVDDSHFFLKAIKAILSGHPDIEVVGTATNGFQALKMVEKFQPDVVTLDVRMPEMDGLQTLSRMLAKRPKLRVIMISAYSQEGADITLTALQQGAVDFVDKSQFKVDEFDRLAARIIERLKVWQGYAKNNGVFGVEQKEEEHEPSGRTKTSDNTLKKINWAQYEICIIGASTGGPPFIAAIMDTIPNGFPLPILVVQHMPPGFTGPFAHRLNHDSNMQVAEAGDAYKLKPGYAYIAPAGFQTTIEEKGVLTVVKGALQEPHKPSVDRSLISVADIYGKKAIAFLLTGMGRDGAEGLYQLKRKGGMTIAEDESSCVVYGMPRAAIEIGATSYVADKSHILKLFSNAKA